MLLHRASFGAASVVGTVHVVMAVVSAVSFRTWFRARARWNHAAGQSEQGGGSYAQAQCGFDFRQMNHSIHPLMGNGVGNGRILAFSGSMKLKTTNRSPKINRFTPRTLTDGRVAVYVACVKLVFRFFVESAAERVYFDSY